MVFQAHKWYTLKMYFFMGFFPFSPQFPPNTFKLLYCRSSANSVKAFMTITDIYQQFSVHIVPFLLSLILSLCLTNLVIISQREEHLQIIIDSSEMN